MVYESQHPLVKHKLTLLRDRRTKPKKFRELIRELAMLLCYEATADLAVTQMMVETPMETAVGYDLTEKVGLVPVLRAGLGMVDGIWEMMPGAEVWHIGLYRDEKNVKAGFLLQPAAHFAHGRGVPGVGPHAGYRRFGRSHRGHFEAMGRAAH